MSAHHFASTPISLGDHLKLRALAKKLGSEVAARRLVVEAGLRELAAASEKKKPKAKKPKAKKPAKKPAKKKAAEE